MGRFNFNYSIGVDDLNKYTYQEIAYQIEPPPTVHHTQLQMS